MHFEDDPFLQGSTQNRDDGDPFLIIEGPHSNRKNLLPASDLHYLFQFCDARTLINCAQVNSFWNEEASSETVWKRLCKAKYGSEALSSVKNMGWKICYFVGICKSVFVKTPGKQVIGLAPYPGLNIQNMLQVVGLQKALHFMLSSEQFSGPFEADAEDMDLSRGISGALAVIRLCDILVEPVSYISIEVVPEVARRSPKNSDVRRSISGEQPITVNEGQVKEQWKVLAIKALAQYPTFVQQWMATHEPFMRDSVQRRLEECRRQLKHLAAPHDHLGLGPPVNSPTAPY